MAPARVFWVDAPSVGRIAVCGRPRAVREFAELKAEGVDVLVSMLEAEEAASLGLADEAGLCAAAGIEFFALPIRDHGIPDTVEAVSHLSGLLRQRLAAGKGVAAHCYAGLGRSPTLIAAILIDSGFDAIEACDLISAGRGHSVPEMASQSDWLLAYEMRTRNA